MMRNTFFILLLSLGTPLLAQDSLFRQAEFHFQAAEYQEAYDAFKVGGFEYRETGNKEQYALCSIRMALCLSRLAAFNESLQLANNTIAYLEQVVPDNRFLMAEALRAMGDAYLNLGRISQAQEVLLEAEKFYPPQAELEKAEAFKLLGVIYNTTENRDLALQYLNQALDINKNKLGEESLAVADVNNNMGLIYIDEDGLQAGIYLNRALKIYESNLGTLHPKVAFTLINLARARSNQGLNQDAIEIIDKVRNIWDRLYEGDHPSKAFTTQALGRIYENQGNYSEAMHFQEMALKQYVKLFGDKHPDVANSYFLIAKLHQRTREYRDAVLAFQQSIFANIPDQNFDDKYDLPSLSNYFNGDILLSALIGKAQALEALHFEKTLKARDLKEAISAYSVADTLVTEIRKIRVTEQDKIRLTEFSKDIYENGIRLSLVLADQPFHSKYNFLAFRFCERSKSSVLLEAIQETKAKSFSGIPEELIRYEDSIKSEMAYYQQKIASGENIDQNQDALFNFQQLYRDHIARLETEFPKYYNLKYQNPTFDLESIQSYIGANIAVLSYYDATDRMYIFVLTQKDLEVVEVPKDPEDYKLISGLRNAVKYRITSNFDEISTDLHQFLIPDLPRGTRQLIVIPDGILNTLPFETLMDPVSGKYLIEKVAVSYDYSINLMIERLKQERSSETSGKDILLVAPVDFSECTMKLSSLPATESELREIRYLFTGNEWEVHPYLKSDASEAFVKSGSLENFRYLHFATHGMVNESKPELSQIFLSPDQSEDGSLYSGDIYNLRINAELVSLSACETGLGQIAQGEGVLGLSRALLYAGAQNLMVSLWQVADQSTAELMIEFYQQHLFYDHVNSFSEALRQAKLKMIASENYNLPYFWAPFILVGQ